MRNTKPIRTTLLTVASAFALSLSACSDETVEEGSGEASTQTVAALIADDGDLSHVEELLQDAGMSEVFDGNAAYTIFAPTDTALESLGEAFDGEDARPAQIAILREHIVPGYLTTEDIAAAIESAGGSVEMQTMGDGALTFSMDGEQVMVTGSNSASSSPMTGELLGANGVVVPVEIVLKDTSTS